MELIRKDNGMIQVNNRVLVLEEAVAGLLRRVRGLEARISELEKRRKTDLMQQKKDGGPSVDKKPGSGETTPRPYRWADLRKTGKPFT